MPRQLHSIDRLFLDIETEKHSMAITPLYFYDPQGLPDGVFNYDNFVEHLNNCIVTMPVLCGKLHRVTLDLENPYLVKDDSYDVHNHITHIELDNPHCVKELSKRITDFQELPINTNRPLWEVLIISNLQVKTLPANSFLIAIKIHHAVADGMTIMNLTAKLHGLIPLGKPAKLASSSSILNSNIISTASRIFSANVKQAVQFVNPLFKVAPQLSMSVINYYFEHFSNQREEIPVTRFAGPVGQERIWGYTLVEIDKLKEVRDLLPFCTLNDLVLTIIAGALREYLKDKNELPHTAMRALAPINVRSECELGQAGNEISLMSLSLPVEIEDPIERLLAVNKFSDNAKVKQQRLGSRNMSDLMKNIPAAYLTYINKAFGTGPAHRLIGQLGNTVVTNVPGPEKELSLMGAKLAILAGAAPVGDGVGLFHSVASYNGKISINVSSCPEIIPDVKFYIECLQKSYEALLHSVDEKLDKRVNA